MPAHEPTPSWNPILQLFGALAGLSTLAGAVAYALVRYSYSRFYDQLGVTPEQIGLGFSDSLVRAASTVGVPRYRLTSAYVLLLIPLVLFVWPRIEEEHDENNTGAEKTQWWEWVSWVAAVALAVVFTRSPDDVLNLGAEEAPWGLEEIWPGSALPTLTGIALLLILVSFGLAPSKRSRLVRWPRVPAAYMAIGAASLLLALLPAFEFPGYAAGAGSTIREGFDMPAREDRYGTLPRLGVRADRVALRWLQEKPKGLQLGSCLRYLGAAGDTLYLYDVTRQSLIRLPASEVVVSTKGTSCYS